jgi:hypothetical protein
MQSDVGKLEAMQEINYHNDLCSRSVLYVCGARRHFPDRPRGALSGNNESVPRWVPPGSFIVKYCG